MVTWAGALVETRGRADLPAIVVFLVASALLGVLTAR